MLVSSCVVMNALVALIAERRQRTPSSPDRPRPQEAILPSLVTVVVLILLGFLATLPTHPPFAAGQRLGGGFLAGGIFALAAAWMMRTRIGGYATAMCAWATLGVGLTFWEFRGYPDDALMGFALAACLVAFLTTHHAPLINTYLVATVALVAALLMAEAHFSARSPGGVSERLWNVFPLTLSALGLVAGTLSQCVRRMKPHRTWAGATLEYLIALFVLGGGAWWLTQNLLDAPSLFLPVATGIVSGAVLSLFVQGFRVQGLGFGKSEASDYPSTLNSQPFTHAALPALVVLLTYLNCVRTLSGYGAALGALAMLTFFLSTDAERSTERQPLTIPFASALVVAALFRLFLDWNDLEGVRLSLYTHYVTFGLTIGIVVPWCLREMGNGETRAWGNVVSRLLLGFACIALTPLVFVFWGFNAVAGLVAGLFFAELLAPLPAFSQQSERRQFPLNLLTFGVTLVALQFTHLLVNSESGVTRLVKIRVAEVGIGMAVVLLLARAARLWLKMRKKV
jgi:hypothetical protein